MQLNKQKALQELGIPEEFYDELMGDFITQTEGVLNKLDMLKETDNFEEIAKLAHFIKGSAGNLRIDELYSIAKEIEFTAKEKKNIISSVEKLKSSFQGLKKIVLQDK